MPGSAVASKDCVPTCTAIPELFTPPDTLRESGSFGRECREARLELLQQRSKIRIIANGQEYQQSEAPRVRWIDIEAPNERTLHSVGKKLGISDGTLALCTHERTVPQTFSRSDALYLSFPELTASSEDPFSLHVSTVHAIIGPGYLVTIHKNPSSSVRWVESELREGKMFPPDYQFSNHLMARLVGSSLHSNTQFISSLESARERLIGFGATGAPAPETLQKITKMEAGLHLAQATLSHIGPILDVLGEKESLFGADQPKGALGRYHGMVQSMLQSIELSRGAIRSSRENWELESEAASNRSSFRLAFLGGVLGPPGVYAGVVQTAIAAGAKMSIESFWTGLAGVAAVSAVLTTVLVRDYFKRRAAKAF